MVRQSETNVPAGQALDSAGNWARPQPLVPAIHISFPSELLPEEQQQEKQLDISAAHAASSSSIDIYRSA
jgi:hypothetical protein